MAERPDPASAPVEHTLRIADSPVMGRLAALVTATLVGLAGAKQLITGDATYIVSGFGGMRADDVWACCLVLAAAFLWVGRLWRDPIEEAIIELGGCVLLAVPLAVYDLSLVVTGVDGRTVAGALASSAVLNVTGRALLLVRRLRWIRRIRITETGLGAGPGR